MEDLRRDFLGRCFSLDLDVSGSGACSLSWAFAVIVSEIVILCLKISEGSSRGSSRGADRAVPAQVGQPLQLSSKRLKFKT